MEKSQVDCISVTEISTLLVQSLVAATARGDLVTCQQLSYTVDDVLLSS